MTASSEVEVQGVVVVEKVERSCSSKKEIMELVDLGEWLVEVEVEVDIGKGILQDRYMVVEVEVEMEETAEDGVLIMLCPCLITKYPSQKSKPSSSFLTSISVTSFTLSACS
ncbi:uncharacterized protein HKW66_Vig0006540 [Vigna angularis]|uniref:Uncharacterized protein n=1 Tax=Phaseolus angularis TaxID=3914 RepID=A0A8T0LCQ2_PHAAN|nr:uncharacterized protein HKW66_Vig0006540 [Vigna angularis]